jgi:hypothetical protein
MKDGLRLYHRLLTFVAGMSFCAVAGAANEPSTLCAIPENPGIVTTCFFDLTKPPSSSQARADVLSGGLFRVPAADGELGQGFNGVLQSFVRIQEDGNGGTNASGISTAGYDTTAGGDIPKVTVCDGSGTGANCKQSFGFLLDESRPGGVNARISLDAFKLFVAWNGLRDPREASDSEWRNTEAPDTNTAQGGHRPRAASDSEWSNAESPDENTAHGRHHAAQAGEGRTTRDATRHRPAAPLRVQRPGRLDAEEWSPRSEGLPGQAPTPATALLLGLGLVALVAVRRTTVTKRDRVLPA